MLASGELALSLNYRPLELPPVSQESARNRSAPTHAALGCAPSPRALGPRAMEVTGRRLSRGRLPQHARPSTPETGPTAFAGSWFASTPAKLSRPASATTLRKTPPRGYLARPPVSPERPSSYERPQSAPLRREPVSPPAAKMRTLSASPDAHMFLSTASLLSDSRLSLIHI